MEFLRIEEDGSLLVVKEDPTQDLETLQELENGTLSVVRYRGNAFQQLEILDSGEGEELEDFETEWTAVQVAK